jgi:hypothetical protein
MPLHQIERWTGTFFRAACLWEVGNYILVPHYSSTGKLCNELEFQKENLEAYQKEKDQAEQFVLSQAALGADRAARKPSTGWEGLRSSGETEYQGDAHEENDEYSDEILDDDIQVSAGYLDQMMPHDTDSRENNHPLGSKTAQSDTREEPVQHSASKIPPENPLELPLNAAQSFLPQGAGDSATHAHPPRRDSLHNTYVRVIHVNGVHHLALVTCTCLAADNIHANLLSCRLIPTTFTRYRTLFTATALDDYRISNLECKISAYQYYNKLRRLTNPAAPASVPSFYHELLRLSRLWRWMKKLKWAGYGYKTKDHNSLQSGELANFCPACPQPGINLPLNWKNDVNRCGGYILLINGTKRWL